MFKKLFNKPEIIVVFISLLFTLLVSSAFGLAGMLIVGKFWGFFLISFVLQFVIFAIVNTFLRRKDLIETTKLINQQLEATSKHIINLSCSYCQISNSLPIVLNEENRFKCESCNQVNGVKMQFFSTQITTPLKKVMIPVGDEEVEFKTSLAS
jgi:uncharacterized membrane protein